VSRPGLGGPPVAAAAVVEPAAAVGARHLDQLLSALDAFRVQVDRLARWGTELGRRLADGQRLLATGNGGSFAQAQHLTSELVGRFEGERRPLSALVLGADVASLTAIGNDYGSDEAFARQVRAHGRRGDVLLALSTSGRSPNVVGACQAARDLDVTVWSLTGPGPNPVGLLSDETVAVAAGRVATVQEVHQVAIHVLCAAVDLAVTTTGGQVTPDAPLVLLR
jgi:phosphoheptose isomerase